MKLCCPEDGVRKGTVRIHIRIMTTMEKSRKYVRRSTVVSESYKKVMSDNSESSSSSTAAEVGFKGFSVGAEHSASSAWQSISDVVTHNKALTSYYQEDEVVHHDGTTQIWAIKTTTFIFPGGATASEETHIQLGTVQTADLCEPMIEAKCKNPYLKEAWQSIGENDVNLKSSTLETQFTVIQKLPKDYGLVTWAFIDQFSGDDQGSGADRHIRYCRPTNEFLGFGDSQCDFRGPAVKLGDLQKALKQGVVAYPLGFRKVWEHREGGKYFRVYEPVPPEGFVAIGVMFSFGKTENENESVTTYRGGEPKVNNLLTISEGHPGLNKRTQTKFHNSPLVVWDDTGSGCSYHLSVINLHHYALWPVNTNLNKHTKDPEIYDLDA